MHSHVRGGSRILEGGANYIGGPARPPQPGAKLQSDDIVIMKRIIIIAHKKKQLKVYMVWLDMLQLQQHAS